MRKCETFEVPGTAGAAYSRLRAVRRLWSSGLQIMCAAALIIAALPLRVCLAAERGGAVDVVPFGEVKSWGADGKDYGVFWEDARDIFRVVVRFADSATGAKPDGVRLEYWQSSWAHQGIPRDNPAGGGSAGGG